MTSDPFEHLRQSDSCLRPHTTSGRTYLCWAPDWLCQLTHTPDGRRKGEVTGHYVDDRFQCRTMMVLGPATMAMPAGEGMVDIDDGHPASGLYDAMSLAVEDVDGVSTRPGGLFLFAGAVARDEVTRLPGTWHSGLAACRAQKVTTVGSPAGGELTSE